jgi:hypothetical protein
LYSKALERSSRPSDRRGWSESTWHACCWLPWLVGELEYSGVLQQAMMILTRELYLQDRLRADKYEAEGKAKKRFEEHDRA